MSSVTKLDCNQGAIERSVSYSKSRWRQTGYLVGLPLQGLDSKDFEQMVHEWLIKYPVRSVTPQFFPPGFAPLLITKSHDNHLLSGVSFSSCKPVVETADLLERMEGGADGFATFKYRPFFSAPVAPPPVLRACFKCCTYKGDGEAKPTQPFGAELHEVGGRLVPYDLCKSCYDQMNSECIRFEDQKRTHFSGVLEGEGKDLCPHVFGHQDKQRHRVVILGATPTHKQGLDFAYAFTVCFEGMPDDAEAGDWNFTQYLHYRSGETVTWTRLSDVEAARLMIDFGVNDHDVKALASQHVVLKGLTTDPELNGERALVLGPETEGRLPVRVLQSGREIRVKPENTEPAPSTA